MQNIFASLVIAFISTPLYGTSLDEQLASRALRRATEFYREQVSIEGAYLWQYAADLSRGEGELAATRTQAWVQSPGTPAVGMALLDAYRKTGDEYLLQAARDAVHALVHTQLRSGGWAYCIEFDPAKRGAYAYRVDQDAVKNAQNRTTLDDDTTQGAMRFLIQFDEATKFQDKTIHEAALYALGRLIDAQYANGAWPQWFEKPIGSQGHAPRKANYPPTWPRVWPNKSYGQFYTLNDGALLDVIETMLLAAKVYGESRYMDAAKRGGDFLLLAQMPEPQPAWAQQYNNQMHPAWARKFEPPAITGGESQSAMVTLLALYRATGDKRYLEAVPPALEYLKASVLPNGRFARFYELKTNRPLYFNRKYELTYDDSDLPTHYQFQPASRLASIEAEYEKARRFGPPKAPASADRPLRMSHELAERTSQAVAALDERGAWVETGRLKTYPTEKNTDRIIDSATFIRNVTTLSDFIAASKK